MPIEALRLSHYTVTNALGHGLAASWSALREGRSGLRPNDYPPACGDAALTTWLGRVEGLEAVSLPETLQDYDCRNNRLALLGLQQDGFVAAVAELRERLGARHIGLFLGTSTSGIEQTEQAFARRDEQGRLPADYRYRQTQSPFSLADFCRRYLGLEGPVQVISTACSSSAKVFASAERHIAAGLCDAAVVGGVDSLCQSTLYGFNSLELVSSQPCRPWDATRDGINIGEGAGFALLQRAGAVSAGPRLLGYGESSDAWHMSTPHPEGDGAVAAMAQALARAGLEPGAIDYVNLHGTSTPSNDRAEDRAMVRVFGSSTPCSSTKGWTGHTLGAAGITEIVFAALALEHGWIPPSLNTQAIEPGLQAGVVLAGRSQPLRRVMSNSFGFGGSNCSVILGVDDGA